MAGHIHWLYHAAVVKGTDILGKHSVFSFRFNVKSLATSDRTAVFVNKSILQNTHDLPVWDSVTKRNRETLGPYATQ